MWPSLPIGLLFMGVGRKGDWRPSQITRGLKLIKDSWSLSPTQSTPSGKKPFLNSKFFSKNEIIKELKIPLHFLVPLPFPFLSPSVSRFLLFYNVGLNSPLFHVSILDKTASSMFCLTLSRSHVHTLPHLLDGLPKMCPITLSTYPALMGLGPQTRKHLHSCKLITTSLDP